jgi:hypothetical protein
MQVPGIKGFYEGIRILRGRKQIAVNREVPTVLSFRAK